MKKFNVGIKAIIIKDGKVLLLKKAGEGEYWEVPGGRIDGDESIEQTMDRELHEEVPNISAFKLLGVMDTFRLPRDIAPDLSLVLIYYAVQADFDGDPQISDEHVAWKWCDQIEALQLAESGSHQALKRAFQLAN